MKIMNKDYKISRERYQSLSKKEKKKGQYGCERYKNLTEDEKQKLVEYRKKFIKGDKKMLYYNYKKVLF